MGPEVVDSQRQRLAKPCRADSKCATGVLAAAQKVQHCHSQRRHHTGALTAVAVKVF